MKIKNLFKSILFGGFIMLSTTSCNDWLAVDMEDGIMENNLFGTNDGYLAALNGVYNKMNETYGSTLTMGEIDAMAQYYSISHNSSHVYYAFATYNYSQSNVEAVSGNIWTNLYNLIANLNAVLEHCDENDSQLSSKYYPFVKGEALALRAMLHFDLLRIYGPIYSSDTEAVQTIPYQETTSKDIQPILPAKEVIEKVIRDLNAAAELLKDDPIRTNGVMNSDSEDPNESNKLRYRQYRLNYYAVQGLLARAYLWQGNRTKAYEYAHSLITETQEKNTFPWTTRGAVTSAAAPDRLFSSEVVFALYNLNRVAFYNAKFGGNSSDVNQCLVFPGSELESLDSKITTFYSDKDDLRRNDIMWEVKDIKTEDSTTGAVTENRAICLNKYADFSSNLSFRYMIPLLRMSEIYLIEAECSSNQEEAVADINAIRKARNCVNITLDPNASEEELTNYITAEFAREVIGEGQLFFYYKRHAMQEIASGTDANEKYNMEVSNYVWPLPKIETDKRLTD